MKKNLLSYRCMIFVIIAAVITVIALIFTYIIVSDTLWIWIWAAFFAAILVMAVCAYYLLWKPYCETAERLNDIADRPVEKNLYQLRWPYNRQMQQAMLRTWEQIEFLTAMDVNKRQAQYQALQNQINPHFLYNTLESIRSEALRSELKSVAQMCEALAAFFRYTISNMEDMVTMDEELQNVRTYFFIQQYRFGERLHLNVEYDSEDQEIIKQCLLPKLTLQPIVENALVHGIEDKIGDVTVTIKLVLTHTRLIVTVSDDGVGMSPQTLNLINQRIHARAVGGKGKGGIAIGNVNNRIKIMFGEIYGLTVYSTEEVGTDVEISLPYTTKQDSAPIQPKGKMT